jgi:hypothetical protein
MDKKDAPKSRVFISYRREDSAHAEWLQARLERAGIEVWRDKAAVWPGDAWQSKIRNAITGGTLVFLACFSASSLARRESWQNEELRLAVGQMRLLAPDQPFLIPVRFDNCDIPDIDLGPRQTLRSIHRSDLFGPDAEAEAARLISAVRRILASAADDAVVAERHTSGADGPAANYDEEDLSGGRSGRLRWPRVALASGALAVMVAVLIAWAIAPEPPAAKACQQTATISGAATAALAFTVRARLQCAQPDGEQAYVVVQLLDEGKKGTVKHSEYYLAWDLKNTIQPQCFSDTPSGCTERRYYVINIDLDQLTLLQQSQKTSSGSYYGEPIDTVIGKYIISNTETNHSCAST